MDLTCFKMIVVSLMYAYSTFYINIIHYLEQCGNLPPPVNGRVDASGNDPGSVANYQCNNGYALNVDLKRQCLPTSNWSGFQPSCFSKL